MNKVLKWLGAFIFITVIGIQSVSASSVNDESAIDTSNISIEQQDDISDYFPPLNTPVELRGSTPDSLSTVFSMRVGPFAGWDYAYVLPNPREIQTFTFVPTGNGTVLIRANNANWSGFEYFNISNRGYVYLDRIANAREFIVFNFRENEIAISDAQTRQSVGIFRSGGFDYVTIGSGTRGVFWEFKVR